MAKQKEWYKSRTLWVNTLVAFAGILMALADNIAAGGTITLFGIVNIVLRIVTNTQLK